MPRGGIIFDLQPHSARNLLALHCKERRVSDSLLRFFEWRSRTHISTRKKEWRKWSSATHQTGRYSRQVELRPLIATVWLFFFFLPSIRGYAIDCGSHGAEVFYRFWTLSFDARLWSADNFMFKGLFEKSCVRHRFFLHF